MKKKCALVFMSLLFFSCERNNSFDLKIIEKYNAQIEEGYSNNETWVKSPLSIAIKLSEAGTLSNSVNIKMEKLSGGETYLEAIVTIKEKGVLDDSNPNSDYFFHLKYIDTMWRVIR